MNQDHHDYLEIHPGDADAEAGQMEPGEQKYPGVEDPSQYYPDKEPDQSPFPPENATPETTEQDPARQTVSTESEMDPFTPPPADPEPQDNQPRGSRAGERPKIHRVSRPVGENGVMIERDMDVTPQTCPYAFSGVNLASMRRAQLRKVFKGLGFDPDPQMSKQELLKVLISKINSGEVAAEPAE